MHPEQTDLALYAGGELGRWRRWRLARHLARCPACREQVEEFRRWRQWMRGHEELPAGVQWNRLAAEMTANIRVGLAAGECVGPIEDGAPARWRAPALALPVLLLVLAGWLLQVWRPPLRRAPAASGVVLAATAAGVELRQAGGALTLLHPQAGDVSRLASGDGVHVRYVDSETGYVTISHVYAE